MTILLIVAVPLFMALFIILMERLEVRALRTPEDAADGIVTGSSGSAHTAERGDSLAADKATHAKTA